MRLHPNRGLVALPALRRQPSQTVSPPSPGHNRRLVPYRPPFPIQHLQPSRQCGLPNRAHLRGHVDFTSTGSYPWGHVHGDRSFRVVHGDRSFGRSRGPWGQVRSVLIPFYGDRSCDRSIFSDRDRARVPSMGTGRFRGASNGDGSILSSTGTSRLEPAESAFLNERAVHQPPDR